MLKILSTKLLPLRADERGVTSVEYAVIAGLIIAGVTTAFTAFTGQLNTFLAGLTL
jgi:Flp pilus assembly pilin Flp